MLARCDATHQGQFASVSNPTTGQVDIRVEGASLSGWEAGRRPVSLCAAQPAPAAQAGAPVSEPP